MRFHVVAGKRRYAFLCLFALLAVVTASSFVAATDVPTIDPPVECPPPVSTSCPDSTVTPPPPDPGTTSIDPNLLINVLVTLLGII